MILTEGAIHTLHVSGLAELASGYRYAVWTQDGNEYSWAGPVTLLEDGNGRLVLRSERRIDSVEITIEQTGRSSLPQGPRVLIGIAD